MKTKGLKKKYKLDIQISLDNFPIHDFQFLFKNLYNPLPNPLSSCWINELTNK